MAHMYTKIYTRKSLKCWIYSGKFSWHRNTSVVHSAPKLPCWTNGTVQFSSFLSHPFPVGFCFKIKPGSMGKSLTAQNPTNHKPITTCPQESTCLFLVTPWWSWPYSSFEHNAEICHQPAWSLSLSIDRPVYTVGVLLPQPVLSTWASCLKDHI